MSKKVFGDIVLKWRGNTPRPKAAKFLGVSPRTLESWEQGLRKPGKFTTEAILAKIQAGKKTK